MARIKRANPDDELTLVEHLDELRTRLIVSISVLVIAVSAAYYEYGRIFTLLTDPIHNRRLYSFSPGEAFFTTLGVSVYAGLLISLPVLSYQFYAYVIPAFSEESVRTIRPMLLADADPVPDRRRVRLVRRRPRRPALPGRLQQPKHPLPPPSQRLHPLHRHDTAGDGARVRAARGHDDARPGRHPALDRS